MQIRIARVAAIASLIGCLAVLVGARNGTAPAPPTYLQFVFSSDAHFGITRPRFRGQSNVAARVVNAALVRQVNALPGLKFAEDGGLRAGQAVGPIDFVVEAGDIANREEGTGADAIQAAATSWSEFTSTYLDGLTVTDPAGKRSPVFTVPGNHDVTDAVGFYRPMTPPTDPTAYVAIYNRMMKPATPLTAAALQIDRDRVLTSRDVDGIHLEFLTVWPDSAARAWMTQDLAHVSTSTPVMIFVHDEPDCESKHFRNPNGAHDINDRDKFENLLADTFADGPSTRDKPILEQRALEQFFSRHPNVTAYFHGNSNWNQFYDWTGPDHTVAVHTFRVDSPMKGEISRNDETKLSFQVATLDLAERTLTVRECLWNSSPSNPAARPVWGSSTTVALAPRPSAPGLPNLPAR